MGALKLQEGTTAESNSHLLLLLGPLVNN